MKKATLFRRPNSFIILKHRINRKHFLPIFEQSALRTKYRSHLYPFRRLIFVLILAIL